MIQAGMVWTAGNKLAAAAANAGGLGLIGAGSMKPDLLREHIQKCKEKTQKPFGVNLPLIRGDVDELAKVIVDEGVKIVFTSSGTPQRFAEYFKLRGCIVVHVIASVKHAMKAQACGCDAVVAEGFEAGGHNGLDETTTLCLVPQVVDAVDIPVIAAGGIADGRQVFAALALGAEGVQIGTRFAVTIESSAHHNYKHAVMIADDGGTILTLKKLTPVRLVKNKFAIDAQNAEKSGATKEQLEELLGKKRERLGIFEGDAENGEIEAGQSSGLIKELLTTEEVMQKLLREYREAKEESKSWEM
ncbi:MAG TPA: nitronate monooxygenase [Candidatus Kapabacteria bacterium]|nr:nitronate monooxygenase [Candidatus Kapabacteria bacterium]